MFSSSGPPGSSSGALEDARGEVNKMIASVDGEYRMAKIEADAYFEKQSLLAKAIKAEAVAEAAGIREMNRALVGTGGEATGQAQDRRGPSG